MSPDKIQTWQLLCKQTVKSSSALRAYQEDAEAIADANKSIAYLKDNIHHSRVSGEIFRHLLQIGDHDLIKAAFNHHSVESFLDLQRGHRHVSFKGAVSRGDIVLLRWLKDIGFNVSEASSIIMRAGLDKDRADLFNFARDELTLNKFDTRSQLPYYIRTCGPSCAPFLEEVIAENFDDWQSDLKNFLISSCTKVDVKVAVLLTLYGVQVAPSELPVTLLMKETGSFLCNYLMEMASSNHGKLRLLALEKDRVSALGRPHLSTFAGLKRSEVLMGNF